MSLEEVADPARHQGRDRVILLVEDEILIRLANAEWLRDAGYVVIEAASGAEALDLLFSGKQIDLLVTDISMPGPPDGLEMAVLAKETYPDLPIILASARLPAEGESPASKMLAKPYDVPELLTVVNELIEATWKETNNRKAC